MTAKRKPPPRRVSTKPLRTRGFKPAPPPPKGNTRAVRNGSRADGRNLPGYPLTLAEIDAACAEAPWLKGTDAIAVKELAALVNAQRFTDAYLARLTDTARAKAVNAEKIQIRRAKVIIELCDRLGLTPHGRFKLGLTQAKIERERVRVLPVRNEERGKQVAAMLQAAGALPPPPVVPDAVVDAEIVTEEPPEEPPELIIFPHGGAA